MKKLFLSTVAGIVLFLALSPFSYASPSYGPQTFDIHKYYYFGDDTYPSYASQGLYLNVDGSSVSFQSTKATLTMDYHTIMDRHITKFVILANGVAVDYVEPYFDYTIGEYREYYYLDVDITTQYIGSDVYFQVIGLQEDGHFSGSQNSFVVAWSTQTPTFHFKPLPVTDADTHGWLAEIYDILKQLKDMLQRMLADLTQAVKNIYEIKPSTQQRFDNALSQLQQSLPTEQVKDEVQKAADVVNDSINRVNNVQQPLKFGVINWVTGVSTAVLDFTDISEKVELVRKLLQALLWCEFFYFVILILRPRLTA